MNFIVYRNRHIGWRLAGPEAAPLVLLAHPLGMNQGVWDEIIPLLCARFRVLSWDLPGHGASEPLAASVSVDELADEALALADAAGAKRFHFVGTSIGGAIGQALLKRAPQRLSRVVLTNTGATIGTPDGWAERATRVREEGLIAMSHELAPRWFSPATHETSPALVAGWTQQLARVDDDSYARLCESLASFSLRRTELPDSLPPIALVGGAEDLSTPPATLETLASELDGVPLTILDDVGHVPSVEAPGPLFEQIQHWLRHK